MKPTKEHVWSTDIDTVMEVVKLGILFSSGDTSLIFSLEQDLKMVAVNEDQ